MPMLRNLRASSAKQRPTVPVLQLDARRSADDAPTVPAEPLAGAACWHNPACAGCDGEVMSPRLWFCVQMKNAGVGHERHHGQKVHPASCMATVTCFCRHRTGRARG
jgi:hypothetical protein